MIPRLKPYLGKEEILALFKKRENAVKRFEIEFASQFNTEYAVAFPYGRSALWAFFKSLDLDPFEVVQPAYTCSVVAHATVLSGNIPVFVDINLTDYNMDLDLMAKAITPYTRVIIPTHLFGYPMDINKVKEIVQKAEDKYGHKIWIIQDCAHSFDAKYKGDSVINSGDGAIFGLGISKQITSIFGGMFTTNDEAIAKNLRDFRDSYFLVPSWKKSLKRYLYLLAVYPAFQSFIYGLVYWLQEKTPFLNRLTRDYHLDEKIHFPPDHLDQMTAIEALVGLEQLKKYPAVYSKRIEIANEYFSNIISSSKFILPPEVGGATYSHFVIRTENRDQLLALFASKGIQLGQLIEYSMPHHPAYKIYVQETAFPNSYLCSNSLINLPIYPNLKNAQINRIISLTNTIFQSDEN
ncbi:MAG: DegT/DnrJ/EryC1/StrS aminotransferase family protein [Pelolinea sp.]|nr:DegT/DnrJ/EryC1/StrS aminotransferase family protein [Pelolinea sp.]